MGTLMAFEANDPVSFVFTLILGALQLIGLAALAFWFCRAYWRQLVGVGCALLLLQGTLMAYQAAYNSPTAVKARCIAAAEKSTDILAMYYC